MNSSLSICVLCMISCICQDLGSQVIDCSAVQPPMGNPPLKKSCRNNMIRGKGLMISFLLLFQKYHPPFFFPLSLFFNDLMKKSKLSSSTCSRISCLSERKLQPEEIWHLKDISTVYVGDENGHTSQNEEAKSSIVHLLFHLYNFFL